MRERDDRLLEALTRLQTVGPNVNWEKRVRARCHSQMIRRARRQRQFGRKFAQKPRLVDIAAVVFLVVYFSTFIHAAARLGGFL